MDKAPLAAIQAPAKATYRDDPEGAVVALSAVAKLTERYCVVWQSRQAPAGAMSVSRAG
jgi:hypothetical protein